jgi:hypothetical protein
MPRYDIFVQFMAQAEPAQTSPNSSIKPATSGVSSRDEVLDVQGLATLAIAGNALKNVANDTIGLAGQITANEQLQNNIDDVLQISGYVTQVLIAPVIGGVAVGVQLFTAGNANRILNRNANIQADNQLRFRGVRTDGNR